MHYYTEKLTVVLPIKDRPDFTKRWLEYANEVSLPFHVLVADGSLQSSLDWIGKLDLSAISFSYHYYGPDWAVPIFFEKISAALSQVKTDYVCLVDDDDFQLIDGYLQSVDFLEANMDYIGCGGQTLGLFMQSHADFSITRSAYIQQGLEDSTARSRVKALLTNYRVVFYDVYRSEVLKKIFSRLATNQFYDLFNAELYIACLAATAGRLKKIDTPFLVRQHNNPQSSAKVSASRDGGYFERSLSLNYSAEIRYLFDAILSTAEKVDGAESFRKDDLHIFFKEFMRQRYLYEFLSPLEPISRFQKLFYSVERVFTSHHSLGYIFDNLRSRIDKLQYKTFVARHRNAVCSHLNVANVVGVFLCEYYGGSSKVESSRD